MERRGFLGSLAAWLSVASTSCDRPQQDAPSVEPLDTDRIGPISITEPRSDRPEFERVYRVVVGDGFTVKVSLKWFISNERFNSAELTQKNGRWILFDVHRVADKIIDRELYPLVQAAVDEILRLDKVFIDSRPSEFTDKTGTTWRRITT